MGTPWIVIINTWPYSGEDIERAVASLIGWAEKVIGAELGTWHRSLPELASSGLEISTSEWTGSFRAQYDHLVSEEKRGEFPRVLFLEGNEVIRRMDLHRLEALTNGQESAYRMSIVCGEDQERKEIRVLKPVAWHGFSGIYKPDPYPELAAFCQDIKDIDISLFTGPNPSGPKKDQLEDILLESPVSPLIRARWLIERRKFAEALRYLKKDALLSIDSTPTQIHWQTLVAETLMGMNRPLAALEVLTPLISLSPSADRGYLMGRALYDLQRYEQASTYFFQSGTGMFGEREYQEPGSDSYRSLWWAAHSLIMGKRPKDSFLIVKRLLENYPFFQDAWPLFFRLFAGAKVEELYEILTQFMSPKDLHEVFERLHGMDIDAERFRSWVLR